MGSYYMKYIRARPPPPLPLSLLKPCSPSNSKCTRFEYSHYFTWENSPYVGTACPQTFMPYFLIVSGKVFQIRITGWTGKDPNSVELVNPDSNCGSGPGPGSRKRLIWTRKSEKVYIFMFRRAEGFFWSSKVPHGDFNCYLTGSKTNAINLTNT